MPCTSHEYRARWGAPPPHLHALPEMTGSNVSDGIRQGIVSVRLPMEAPFGTSWIDHVPDTGVVTSQEPLSVKKQEV